MNNNRPPKFIMDIFETSQKLANEICQIKDPEKRFKAYKKNASQLGDCEMERIEYSFSKSDREKYFKPKKTQEELTKFFTEQAEKAIRDPTCNRKNLERFCTINCIPFPEIPKPSEVGTSGVGTSGVGSSSGAGTSGSWRSNNTGSWRSNNTGSGSGSWRSYDDDKPWKPKDKYNDKPWKK